MIKRLLSWFRANCNPVRACINWLTPAAPEVTQVVFYLPSGRRITAEEIEALIEKVERL